MTEALPALLALAFFWPALFADRMPMFGHFADAFLPDRLYSARVLGSGILPLWAPEAGLGEPFLARGVGVFYPPSAIVYLAPNPLGIGLYLAFHFWVAAAGIRALLERHGYSEWSGVFGGIVYVFGGYFVSVPDWGQLAVIAWVPFTLVAAERLAEDPGAGRLLILVAVFALQALGASPHFLVQSVLLALAFALFARGKTPTRRRLTAILVALGLALAISAPQLLPSAERFSQALAVGGLSSSEALGPSFRPESLASLVVRPRPDGSASAIGHEGVLSWSLYVGIAPFALAILAALLRESLGWVALLAVALAFSLGRYTPIVPFLDEHVPGLFATFGSPQSFFLTVHLSLAVLAAVGFSRLERRLIRRGAPATLLVAILSAVTVADLWTAHQPALPFEDWSALVASAPPAPLRAAGAQTRVFRYDPEGGGIAPWVPKISDEGSVLETERQAWAEIAARVPLFYGIAFVDDSDGVHESTRRALDDTLREGPIAADVRLLRALGAGIFLGTRPLDDASLELLRSGGGRQTWIYRTRAAAPRVYLAKSIRAAADRRQAMAALAATSFSPGADAVVEGPLSFARPLAGGAARIEEESSEALTVVTESAEEAFLVVNDSFYPGWIAEIDGARGPILRTNGIARGLWIPAGNHRVAIRYEPRSFQVGLVVCALGFLLAVPLARRHRLRPTI